MDPQVRVLLDMQSDIVQQEHEWECVFPDPTQHRRRHGKRKATDVENRLAQVERLLREQASTSESQVPPALETSGFTMLTPDMSLIASEGTTRSLGTQATRPPSIRQLEQSPAASTLAQGVDQGTRGQASQYGFSYQNQQRHLSNHTKPRDCTSSLWSDSGQTMTVDLDLGPSPLEAEMRDCATQGLEEVTFPDPVLPTFLLTHLLQVNSEHHGESLSGADRHAVSF